MKKLLGMALGLLSTLQAQTVELTAQQEKDWQIKTEMPISSTTLPLGEFIAEVTTPPQQLYTITLPFEAQVKKLYVASYESVKKGELLAEVTGKDWIAIQQQCIENAIEFKHHGHLAERKNRLCKEDIIPKKECHEANAEHQSDKIKVAASKELLRGYGASESMINDLFSNLKIAQSIPIRSEVSGKLLELNLRVGKSTSPSDTLFVVQQEGALWLESDVSAQKAIQLSENQKVNIHFANQSFESKVLLLAPTINATNQTQKVRFSLPKESKILSGMRDTAMISIEHRAFKVAKKSVINNGGKNILFLHSTKGYEPLEVEILAEDTNFYYLAENPKLQTPIATTSIAILKGLMEGKDE